MSPESSGFILQLDVLSDNQQISSRIEAELQAATGEILIAAAWFTDSSFFEIILLKLDQGVKVEIIIADNQENEKLDFPLLESKGALVLKVKNVGYGMMHQKFALFDRRLVIHGSYNWSVNARNNNHESVIVTNDPKTINKLYEVFHSIKEKAINILQGMEDNYSKPVNGYNNGFTPVELNNSNGRSSLKEENKKGLDIQDFNENYAKVLQSLIVSEFADFDRGKLRSEGYENAQSCQGQPQSLVKTFDSLYSVFLNNVNHSDDRKHSIVTKIDEEKIKAKTRVEEIHSLELTTIEQEHQNKKQECENHITSLNGRLEVYNNEITNIQNDKIPEIRDKIEKIRDKIRDIEVDSVKPSIKRFEIVPIALMNFGLLAYLILFYSSAAYIFLFSKQNATDAKLKGITISAPEVFNPYAISEAYEKGFFALIFIFLFVFVPISLALLGIFFKSNLKNKISTGALIILVDSALAYKVTESIYEVEFLSGNQTEQWKFWMAFTDFNFYLVFILGALGLYLLKFAFEKLISIFQDTDQQNLDNKNNVLINHHQQNIDSYQEEISLLKHEVNELRTKIIECNAEKSIKEAEVSKSINDKARTVETIAKKKALALSHIDDITTLYRSHVENNSLVFSVHSMKDRINVFLEGWKLYLFEVFSVTNATEKLRVASQASDEWEAQKLASGVGNGFNI